MIPFLLSNLNFSLQRDFPNLCEVLVNFWSGKKKNSQDVIPCKSILRISMYLET